jgi:hypothetical protein
VRFIDIVHDVADAPVHIQVFEPGKPANEANTDGVAIVPEGFDIFLLIKIIHDIGKQLADNRRVHDLFLPEHLHCNKRPEHFINQFFIR